MDEEILVDHIATYIQEFKIIYKATIFLNGL